MQPNIALTIKTGTSGSTSAIAIDVIGGPHYQFIKNPIAQGQSAYWMVVIDRSNLKVVANFEFTDASTVPPQISKFQNNPDYFYILTTQGMYSVSIPTGALYKWLMAEGAGVALKTVEQAYGALNCSGYAQFAYTIVDVFGPTSHNSMDYYALGETSMLTALELQPFTVNGKTIYSPVEIT